MELRINKKGFAFSFFALFLMIVIYSVGSLYFFQENYSQLNNFKELRIQTLNDEVDYFKNSYVKTAVSYSFYNTLKELLFYLDDNDKFDLINQNPKLFNDLIYEGIVNRSFEGNPIAELEGRTVTNLTRIFNNSFSKNHLGEIEYKILGINIYESKPYTLTIRVIGNYSVTTNDLISSWKFTDEFETDISVIGLNDPQYLIYTDSNFSIRQVDFIRGVTEWNRDLLNRTLLENYSTSYLDPDREYYIGKSFMNRLLNYSYGSYKDVLGQWSFDTDLNKGGVFDSSLYSPFANYTGNTKLIVSMDDNSSLGIVDLNGDIDCSRLGVFRTGCFFDSDKDYLNMSQLDFDLSSTNKLTLSTWFNLSDYESAYAKNSVLFSYGSSSFNLLSLETNNAGEIIIRSGSHNGGSSETFTVEFDELCPGACDYFDKWFHVALTINGDSGDYRFYVNGREYENFTGDTFSNFLASDVDIVIGDSPNDLYENSISGMMDEFVVYTTVADEDYINYLYDLRRADDIDYIDSLHGKAIKFDGIDDNLNISHNFYTNISLHNFSACAWFKPYELGGSQQIFQKGTLSEGHFGIRINDDDLTGYIGGYNFTGAYESETMEFTDVLVENVSYYSCITRRNETYAMYLNRFPRETETSSYYLNLTSEDNLTIGYRSDLGASMFFEGEVDEFKLYNRSINESEFLMNYYNYEGISKGCCNYVNLMNPNRHGFNDVAYSDMVSYSTKLFYDYYERNEPYNIVLWEVPFIFEETDTTEKYYNFRMDACIRDAMGITSYEPPANQNPILAPTEIVNTTDCRELIRMGLY